MRRLENKVAVITGGNSGIGLSTAQAFVREGAKVVVFGRDQSTLDAAVETLGSDAIGVRGNVTNDDDLDTLYDTVKKRFGKVDILFANAGIAEFLPLREASEEHFDRIFNVNVKGVFKTVQRAEAVLNDGASVILNSSNSNQIGFPGTTVYAATKAAVRSFSRTMSSEFLDRKIRVNTVSPGPVLTPIFGRMGLPEEVADGMEDQLASLVPLKRAGQPREIADAIVFLASDESTYMVGAEMVLDGGHSQL